MDANRVRMLEDGIGSFDVSDVGPDHGVPIDPFSAERIEVVRGAATLRYGSQAIGRLSSTPSATAFRCICPRARWVASSSATLAAGADSRDFAGQFNARPGQFAFHADAYDRQS